MTDATRTAPVSKHPAFKWGVGLWFALLMGLGLFVMPESIHQALAERLSLDGVLSAASSSFSHSRRRIRSARRLYGAQSRCSDTNKYRRQLTRGSICLSGSKQRTAAAHPDPLSDWTIIGWTVMRLATLSHLRPSPHAGRHTLCTCANTGTTDGPRANFRSLRPYRVCSSSVESSTSICVES